MAKSALIFIFGLAITVWGVALDTWRADSRSSRALLLTGLAIMAVAVLGVLISGLRSAMNGGPTWVKAGMVLAFLLAIGGAAGIGYLYNRGEQINLLHMYTNYMANPFGRQRIERTPAGLLAFETGRGHAYELTQYDLDVTPSGEQLAAAMKLYNDTHHAAMKYSDFAQTTGPLGFTVSLNGVSGNAKGQINHFFNPAYMADDKELDPERPESLVYDMHATPPRLVGIMYFAKAGKHGAQIGGPLTRWHYHTTVPYCQDPSGLPRFALTSPCPAGTNTGPSAEMMHVWLVDHKYGVFTHRMDVGASPGAGASGGGHQH